MRKMKATGRFLLFILILHFACLSDADVTFTRPGSESANAIIEVLDRMNYPAKDNCTVGNELDNCPDPVKESFSEIYRNGLAGNMNVVDAWIRNWFTPTTADNKDARTTCDLSAPQDIDLNLLETQINQNLGFKNSVSSIRRNCIQHIPSLIGNDLEEEDLKLGQAYVMADYARRNFQLEEATRDLLNATNQLKLTLGKSPVNCASMQTAHLDQYCKSLRRCNNASNQRTLLKSKAETMLNHLNRLQSIDFKLAGKMGPLQANYRKQLEEAREHLLSSNPILTGESVQRYYEKYGANQIMSVEGFLPFFRDELKRHERDMQKKLSDITNAHRCLNGRSKNCDDFEEQMAGLTTYDRRPEYKNASELNQVSSFHRCVSRVKEARNKADDIIGDVLISSAIALTPMGALGAIRMAATAAKVTTQTAARGNLATNVVGLSGDVVFAGYEIDKTAKRCMDRSAELMLASKDVPKSCDSYVENIVATNNLSDCAGDIALAAVLIAPVGLQAGYIVKQARKPTAKPPTPDPDVLRQLPPKGNEIKVDPSFEKAMPSMAQSREEFVKQLDGGKNLKADEVNEVLDIADKMGVERQVRYYLQEEESYLFLGDFVSKFRHHSSDPEFVEIAKTRITQIFSRPLPFDVVRDGINSMIGNAGQALRNITVHKANATPILDRMAKKSSEIEKLAIRSRGGGDGTSSLQLHEHVSQFNPQQERAFLKLMKRYPVKSDKIYEVIDRAAGEAGVVRVADRATGLGLNRLRKQLYETSDRTVLGRLIHEMDGLDSGSLRRVNEWLRSRPLSMDSLPGIYRMTENMVRKPTVAREIDELSAEVNRQIAKSPRRKRKSLTNNLSTEGFSDRSLFETLSGVRSFSPSERRSLAKEIVEKMKSENLTSTEATLDIYATSGKNKIRPIAHREIEVDQVLSSHQAGMRELEKIDNISYRSSSETSSYVEGAVLRGNLKHENPRGFVEEIQKSDLVQTIIEVRPSGKLFAGVNSKALSHPQMPKAFEEMQRLGIRLQVDTSLKHTGTGAYYSITDNVVFLRPDSEWSTFIHEFEHAKFNRWVGRDFIETSKAVRSGQRLRHVLDPEIAKEMGRRRVRNIERMMEQGYSRSPVDEFMATDAERRLRVLRIAPGPRVYGLKYQRQDLLARIENTQSKKEKKELEKLLGKVTRQITFYQRLAGSNSRLPSASEIAIASAIPFFGGWTAYGGILLWDEYKDELYALFGDGSTKVLARRDEPQF